MTEKANNMIKQQLLMHHDEVLCKISVVCHTKDISVLTYNTQN
jgi:hypothetical protein